MARADDLQKMKIIIFFGQLEEEEDPSLTRAAGYIGRQRGGCSRCAARSAAAAAGAGHRQLLKADTRTHLLLRYLIKATRMYTGLGHLIIILLLRIQCRGGL